MAHAWLNVFFLFNFCSVFAIKHSLVSQRSVLLSAFLTFVFVVTRSYIYTIFNLHQLAPLSVFLRDPKLGTVWIRVNGYCMVLRQFRHNGHRRTHLLRRIVWQHRQHRARLVQLNRHLYVAELVRRSVFVNNMYFIWSHAQAHTQAECCFCGPALYCVWLDLK